MPKISAPTLHQHRAGTIERLLDAWGELVMAEGYDQVSLALLAKKVGMARTAIYNYFPDKETLLFAWTDREVQRTIHEMTDKIAGEDSCSGKMRVAVHLQLKSFTDRHLPPGQEVAQLLRRDSHERFMKHIEPLEQAVREVIAEGIDTGEFSDAIDPATTVPMVLACIGAERVPLATGAHELDETTARVTDFVLRALGADLPARPRAVKKAGKRPRAR
jgi:AcrR family transcriptional regulator